MNKPLDFTTKNKGLRLLATLFTSNVDIFKTDSFIDIYTSVDIFTYLKNHLFLLYDDTLYDEYIKSALRDNNNFLYEYIVCYENRKYYLYIFNVPSSSRTLYNGLLTIGSRAMTDLDFFNTFLLWQEYLSKEFYELHYIDKCEKCLKIKGANYFQRLFCYSLRICFLQQLRLLGMSLSSITFLYGVSCIKFFSNTVIPLYAPLVIFLFNSTPSFTKLYATSLG